MILSILLEYGKKRVSAVAVENLKKSLTIVLNRVNIKKNEKIIMDGIQALLNKSKDENDL
jgi:hypothetical protein